MIIQYLKLLLQKKKTSGLSQYIDFHHKEEFIGEFENNTLNGFEKYTYKKSNLIISGYFQNDSLNGIGIEISNQEGNVYYGEFYKNKKQGFGMIKWNDGILYKGEFFNNKLIGYAIIEYPKKEIYKGQINKGKLDGYGEFIWPEGKKYIGYYKNDKKEGFGIFLWNNNEYNKNNNSTNNPESIKSDKMKSFIGFWSKGTSNGIGIKIGNGKNKYRLWKNGNKIMRFKNKEIIKKYIDKTQEKYLKIFLGSEKNILKLLNKCCSCEDEINNEI